MRPSKRAAAAAWVLVTLLAAALTVQAWPEHHNRDGARSTIGVVR